MIDKIDWFTGIDDGNIQEYNDIWYLSYFTAKTSVSYYIIYHITTIIANLFMLTASRSLSCKSDTVLLHGEYFSGST